jgi:multidrug efflux pump subunit AcrB
MKAAELALRQGPGLLFLAVCAAAWGFWAAQHQPKGVYPEVTFPREQVVASAPGSSAQAVLAGLTRPLEDGLRGVPGLLSVKSRTIRGAVELSLRFATDTDMAQAHALVLARLAELTPGLPPAELSATRVSPSGFPVLSFNVEGPYAPERLYELAQYTVRPALSGLPGVGQVTVQSSDVPEVEVVLEPDRMAAAHLTVAQVADRLKRANVVQAVARLSDAHELVLGVVDGELASVEALGAAVVGGTADAPLRVSDLGRIDEAVQPRTALIRTGGKPGVILNVSRRPGGDLLALDAAALAALAALRPALPAGVTFTPVYEQATFVSGAVRGVTDAVLFGSLFAVGVLALFLRDWRATLLASLSLPLTLGAALGVLAGLGQSLNLMTLGGLAMSVGLVIDDAVVVIEAIHRLLEEGLAPEEAARRGTDELFWPVVGTTATTVVVFLPLGLLSGVTGQFFSALSTALAASVLLSMWVALGVLPGLAARWLRPRQARQARDAAAGRYPRALGWALGHRAGVLGAVALAVVGGALTARRVATDFLPESDEGSYVIDYFAPVGASLAEADALAARIEAVVQDTPEVAAFSRRLGAELGPPAATLSSRGDIAVRLRADRTRPIDEVMDAQRARVAQSVPGVRVEFIQVLSDMLGDLEGAPEPIEVKVFGPDPAALRALAAEAAQRLEGTPGLVDFFGGDEGCAPELALMVDGLQSGRLGLAAADIADQLSGNALGVVATQLRRPDHLEDVRVRLAATPARSATDALLRQPLVGAQGERIPVGALARPEGRCAPAALLRDNQRNLVHLTARLSGVSLGDGVRAVRARLDGWKLPTGYTWELGGLYVPQQESLTALVQALLLSLLAVLGVLLFQLRSLRRSLAVLAATPVGLAAGLVTLVVTGSSLNVSSMMGAIVLVGLAVKNGILLLDHALAAEERGRPPQEALLEAAAARLRPILMTTLSTLVALVPLVVGGGASADLHKPLAVVVLGGLGLSTLATLFVVPLLSTRRQGN